MIKAQPLTKRTKFTAAVNPHKRRKITRAKSGAKRRKNPAATVLLGYLNPEKRHMTKTKKSKKIRRAKKNPFFTLRKKQAKRSHRPRRRNPNFGGNILSRPIELVKAGAFGAIAYFITRQLPQTVLKGRNVSWVGYIANLVSALGCATVAQRYFGPVAGQAAFVGGGMYVFSRVLNDNTPYGAQLNLSGVGDPAAAAGLKGIVPGMFLSPTTVSRDGSPVFPPQLVQQIQSQIPAPTPTRAAAGVSGGRFASRW